MPEDPGIRKITELLKIAHINACPLPPVAR
jgi:hypothetical protein